MKAIKDAVGGGCRGPAPLEILLATTKRLVYNLNEMRYPWKDFIDK